MGSRLGPGPNVYRMPTTIGYSGHDPSRFRNPMYSIGVANRKSRDPQSPGPVYKIDRLTRDGVVHTPAWSFSARTPRRLGANAPGPGTHAPERCPVFMATRPPAFSLGKRIIREARGPGPGPNVYKINIHRLFSTGPKWTFTGRPERPPDASPGPAKYYPKNQDVIRTRMPVYTLGPKLFGRKGQANPGPADYPPNLYDTKKRPQAYTFGTKHAEWAPPLILREDEMDCLPR